MQIETVRKQIFSLQWDKIFSRSIDNNKYQYLRQNYFSEWKIMQKDFNKRYFSLKSKNVSFSSFKEEWKILQEEGKRKCVQRYENISTRF